MQQERCTAVKAVSIGRSTILFCHMVSTMARAAAPGAVLTRPMHIRVNETRGNAERQYGDRERLSLLTLDKYWRSARPGSLFILPPRTENNERSLSQLAPIQLRRVIRRKSGRDGLFVERAWIHIADCRSVACNYYMNGRYIGTILPRLTPY